MLGHGGVGGILGTELVEQQLAFACSNSPVVKAQEILELKGNEAGTHYVASLRGPRSEVLSLLIHQILCFTSGICRAVIRGGSLRAKIVPGSGVPLRKSWAK